MKVLSVVGARPNFIKLAPFSREVRAAAHTEVIVHTGQHYDVEMDRIFFDQLHIPSPDYNLGIGSGRHGAQTGSMLQKIEEVLIRENPDIVVVFGDTNSTLAGALAAAKVPVSLAHIESGLRSFDRRMPEEVNRVLVDHISDFLFCPTETAAGHLHDEGILEGVHVSGDVLVDILPECLRMGEQVSSVLSALALESDDYILVTVHRAENTDDFGRLQCIVKALCAIPSKIIFPCHPRTRNRLARFGLLDRLEEKVSLITPVGFLEMLILEKNAKKILTDSGGIQKEAYLLGVPCITLRNTTEWVETVADGWNILVGTDPGAITEAVHSFLPKAPSRNFLGKPGVARRICTILTEEIAT